MLSIRGASPLSYHPISRADIGVIADLELEPEQVERYLGPIGDIQAAVRSGPAHAVTGINADGTLVGFYILHADRRDNACWWLGWLALDRRFQGRGYGRIAMARIMAGLRRIAGCRRVRLLVDPVNTSALRLYSKAGFRPIGRHRSGELILEALLVSVLAIQGVIALLRASSVSKRARRGGRLRLSPGPHAGWIIGVERGPPRRGMTAGFDALHQRCRPCDADPFWWRRRSDWRLKPWLAALGGNVAADGVIDGGPKNMSANEVIGLSVRPVADNRRRFGHADPRQSAKNCRASRIDVRLIELPCRAGG